MTGIGRYVLLSPSAPPSQLKSLCNRVLAATRIIFKVMDRYSSTDAFPRCGALLSTNIKECWLTFDESSCAHWLITEQHFASV